MERIDYTCFNRLSTDTSEQFYAFRGSTRFLTSPSGGGFLLTRLDGVSGNGSATPLESHMVLSNELRLIGIPIEAKRKVDLRTHGGEILLPNFRIKLHLQ